MRSMNIHNDHSRAATAWREYVMSCVQDAWVQGLDAPPTSDASSALGDNC